MLFCIMGIYGDQSVDDILHKKTGNNLSTVIAVILQRDLNLQQFTPQAEVLLLC